MSDYVKCCSCGKFISHNDIQTGAASFYFEPDSHKGPEISEWTCKKCNDELIKICPQCGSGDVRFDEISVRPYCNDCHYWAPVNFGTAQDAIKKWNAML